MMLSKILLISSLLFGMGGWLATLPTWSAALTPISMGGLFMIIGSIVAAWLGQSPIKGK